MFYYNFLKYCNLSGQAPTAVLSAVGISKSANTRWQNGEKPTPANVLKLANHFGIPVENLIQNDAVENKSLLLHDVATTIEKGKDYLMLSTDKDGKLQTTVMIPKNDALSQDAIEVAHAYSGLEGIAAKNMVRRMLGLEDLQQQR